MWSYKQHTQHNSPGSHWTVSTSILNFKKASEQYLPSHLVQVNVALGGTLLTFNLKESNQLDNFEQ